MSVTFVFAGAADWVCPVDVARGVALFDDLLVTSDNPVIPVTESRDRFIRFCHFAHVAIGGAHDDIIQPSEIWNLQWLLRSKAMILLPLSLKYCTEPLTDLLLTTVSTASASAAHRLLLFCNTVCHRHGRPWLSEEQLLPQTDHIVGYDELYEHIMGTENPVRLNTSCAMPPPTGGRYLCGHVRRCMHAAIGADGVYDAHLDCALHGDTEHWVEDYDLACLLPLALQCQATPLVQWLLWQMGSFAERARGQNLGLLKQRKYIRLSLFYRQVLKCYREEDDKTHLQPTWLLDNGFMDYLYTDLLTQTGWQKQEGGWGAVVWWRQWYGRLMSICTEVDEEEQHLLNVMTLVWNPAFAVMVQNENEELDSILLGRYLDLQEDPATTDRQLAAVRDQMRPELLETHGDYMDERDVMYRGHVVRP